jgi:hypothetical protein
MRLCKTLYSGASEMSIETLARQDKAHVKRQGTIYCILQNSFPDRRSFMSNEPLRALRSRTQESHCFT